MRSLRLLSILALTSFGLSAGIDRQDIPTPPPYQGSRTTEYTGKDGEKVKIKSDVSVTFELTLKGKSDRVSWFAQCSNPCHGVPHHKDHSNCDAICDYICEEKHSGKPNVVVLHDLSDLWGALSDCVPTDERLAPRPERETLGPTDNTGKRSSRFGSEQQATDAVWGAMEKLESIEVDFPPTHFTNPCLTIQRDWGSIEHELMAKVTVNVEVTVDGSTDKDSETQEFVVGRVMVPDPSYIVKDKTFLQCACPTGTFIAPPPETVREGQDSPLRQPVQTAGKPKPIVALNFEWIGESLQTIQPRTSGDLEEDVEYFIPPGTEFVSDDPSVQTMASLVGTLVRFDVVGQPEFFELGPGDERRPLKTAKSIRSACTQMAKKEPNGTRFKIGRVKDWRIQALANITNRSRFRGPVDQARIWIYTDKATRTQINEVMIPGVTEAAYLRVLHEVATVAEVDVSVPAYRKCLEPSLLVGLASPFEAKLWFVRTLSRLDPKGLAKFLGDRAADFQNKVVDAETEKYAAELIDALAASPSSEVRGELFAFVNKAIPASRLDAVLGQSKFVQARSRS